MVALSTIALWTCIATAAEPKLVEFSAPGCQHCRVMEATVRRMQAAGYSIERVDAVQRRDVAAQYGVTGTPTYVLMVDDQPVGKIEGATSYDRLVQWVESAKPAGAQGAPTNTSNVSADRNAPTPANPASGRDNSVVDAEPVARRPDPMAVVAAPMPELPKSARARAGATSSEDPEKLAMQATVRLRIPDDTGTSVATGTIIEVHQGEALVLTCGHVFRSSRGKGEILIDLFVPGAGEPLRGELIDFDFYRDIGLVSFRPNVPVKPAPVAGDFPAIEPQTAVFSIGCDNGGQPRLERSKVTRLNRYIGPANVEVSGAPSSGRSGGGLFDAHGALIGVCNAANESENEGIYAALTTVHWQLNQVGLARLIPASPSSTDAIASQGAPPAGTTVPGAQASGAAAAMNGLSNERDRARDLAAMPGTPAAIAASIPSGANAAATPAVTTDHELVVIVRSKSNPHEPIGTYVIDQPQQAMVEHLARTGRPVSPASLVPPGMTMPGPTMPGPTMQNPTNPSIPAPGGPATEIASTRRSGATGAPTSRPPLPEATSPVMRGQEPPSGLWPFRR